jgi:large subunit ribosomal protein L20
MWGRKSKITLAKTAMRKAGVHAYRHRRQKKSAFRQLWNVRINAAVRAHDLSYSRFIAGLKAKNIPLDRKVLAELALEHPKIFDAIVAKVKG